MKMNKKYYHYTGLIHVHSTYSDGARPVPDIMEIANELNVDFLLLTDHNTLKPKKDGLEGWYGNVLLGIGSELNDVNDQNHYLAFDFDEETDRNTPAESYIRMVTEQGGFGIIAHPDEDRSHISKYPPYPWTLWDSDTFDGMEIWNQMSEWMEGLTHFNKFWRVWHPRKSIIAPKKETLWRWDSLNQKRRVVGIGGVDAHGHIHRLMSFFSIRIFRYKVSFKTIRTHIITETPLTPGKNYKDNLQIVYKAIKNANCFVSHYYFGDAGKFSFTFNNGVETVIPGQALPADPNLICNVINPRPAKTYLILNGQISDIQTGKNLSFSATKPGSYRVESHIDGRPWIISNHILITSPAES